MNNKKLINKKENFEVALKMPQEKGFTDTTNLVYWCCICMCYCCISLCLMTFLKRMMG